MAGLVVVPAGSALGVAGFGFTLAAAPGVVPGVVTRGVVVVAAGLFAGAVPGLFAVLLRRRQPA